MEISGVRCCAATARNGNICAFNPTVHLILCRGNSLRNERSRDGCEVEKTCEKGDWLKWDTVGCLSCFGWRSVWRQFIDQFRLCWNANPARITQWIPFENCTCWLSPCIIGGLNDEEARHRYRFAPALTAWRVDEGDNIFPETTPHFLQPLTHPIAAHFPAAAETKHTQRLSIGHIPLTLSTSPANASQKHPTKLIKCFISVDYTM